MMEDIDREYYEGLTAELREHNARLVALLKRAAEIIVVYCPVDEELDQQIHAAISENEPR
jgi:hypothetical protein